MRPRTLEEFRGQDHVLGPGKVLRSMIERGDPGSMILWGPPGSGKTTLARLLADGTDATFVALSAVNEGVAAVRRVINEAKARRAEMGRSTILFCDEIHRFNKAQQDGFLPHVENGTIVLIGATTENPSFEVIRPLLSRAPVVTLKPLSTEDIAEILRSAVADTERGLGSLGLRVDDAALDAMSWAADGDARRGLGILGTAAALAEPGREGGPVACPGGCPAPIRRLRQGGRGALQPHFGPSTRPCEAEIPTPPSTGSPA